MRKPLPSRLPVSLRDLSEAPPVLKRLAAQNLNGEKPGQMLLVPSEVRWVGWWRRETVPVDLLVHTPGRLLRVRGDEDGSAASVWSTPLANLLSVEWGEVLLYSWVRFTAAAGGGLTETWFDYNTVGREHVRRWLVGLMADLFAVNPEGNGPEGLDLGGKLHVKFVNTLRRRLFPWDSLLSVAYQPVVATTRYRFLRQVRFPRALLAVTNEYALLLKDQGETRLESDVMPGTTAVYLPLRCISSVAVESMGDAARLRIELSQGQATTGIEIILALDRLEAFRQPVGHLQRLLTEVHGF